VGNVVYAQFYSFLNIKYSTQMYNLFIILAENLYVGIRHISILALELFKFDVVANI